MVLSSFSSLRFWPQFFTDGLHQRLVRVHIREMDVSRTSINILFLADKAMIIYNESQRRAERRLVFNVPHLKQLAAQSVGRSETDVKNIKKLAEGGFNRVFEITMHDGYSVIARLPYTFNSTNGYATASEVATMRFVERHGIPVPKVLAYSITKDNIVGSEYMIMEKLTGKELGETWFTLSDSERVKLVSQIVKLEALLFSIELPASGSLYYKSDIENELDIKEAEGLNEADEFCIGPDAHYTWWYRERALLPIKRKPYRDTVAVLRAGAERELAWARQYARPRYPYERLHREIYNYQKVSPEDHISNLCDYLKIAEHIAPSPENYLNRPIIRDPDLQPNNIFISDSLDITGIIDWQHCSIRPYFLQSGLPKYFQNYGDEESENLTKPQPPKDLESLSSEEQDAAQELYRRRHLHFYYFAATIKFNKDHFEACSNEHGVLKQKLFQHSSSPWEGDNVTLKADLVRAMQLWEELTATTEKKAPPCPLSYSEEVDKCLKLEAEQKDADEDMEKSRDGLGVSLDGWVPTEQYEQAKEMTQNFKSEVLMAAESDFDRMQIEKHWPFDDYDEDE